MKKIALMLLAMVAAACADEMPRDVREATAARPADSIAPDTSPDPFTVTVVPMPPGGYVAWLSDIRETLPQILQQAAEDRGQAQDALQQLYVARQQPLNDHFGEGGASVASREMADAVAAVESRFDDLRRQLAEAEVPDERLAETVAELQAALSVVEAEGAAAGLSPEAPRQ